MSIPTYGVSHGTSHGTSYGLQYAQNYSPYGYGYQQPAYSLNYGFAAPNSQGTPHYGTSMPPYMGQLGGGHYGQCHGGYANQTYVNQHYQGEGHRPAHPRIPFFATLNLPDLSRLTNDPVSHDPTWPAIPNMLPSDRPKFEGKIGEDPSEHVTTFHLWCSSNSLHEELIRLRFFQCTLTGPAAKWYI